MGELHVAARRRDPGPAANSLTEGCPVNQTLRWLCSRCGERVPQPVAAQGPADGVGVSLSPDSAKNRVPVFMAGLYAGMYYLSEKISLCYEG